MGLIIKLRGTLFSNTPIFPEFVFLGPARVGLDLPDSWLLSHSRDPGDTARRSPGKELALQLVGHCHRSIQQGQPPS